MQYIRRTYVPLGGQHGEARQGSRDLKPLQGLVWVGDGLTFYQQPNGLMPKHFFYEIAALFLLARWRKTVKWGSMSRPETPGFPGKIRLPRNTNTFPIPAPRWLPASEGHSRQYHNSSPLWWDVHAELWEIRGNMIPLTRTWVEDAAPQKPTPHLCTVRLRSRQETPRKTGKEEAYPWETGKTSTKATAT